MNDILEVGRYLLHRKTIGKFVHYFTIYLTNNNVIQIPIFCCHFQTNFLQLIVASEVLV